VSFQHHQYLGLGHQRPALKARVMRASRERMLPATASPDLLGPAILEIYDALEGPPSAVKRTKKARCFCHRGISRTWVIADLVRSEQKYLGAGIRAKRRGTENWKATPLTRRNSIIEHSGRHQGVWAPDFVSVKSTSGT